MRITLICLFILSIYVLMNFSDTTQKQLFDSKPVKRWRGRPKWTKNKPRLQSSGISLFGPKKRLPGRPKKRDGSYWYSFTVLIVIIVLSMSAGGLLVMYLNEWTNQIITEEQRVPSSTGQQELIIISPVEENSYDNKQQAALDAQQTLTDFFAAMNQSNFLRMYQLVTPQLWRASVFREFFGESRIALLLSNLSPDGISIANIVEREVSVNDPDRVVLQFEVEYRLLSSGETFIAQRMSELVRTDFGFRLGSILCETSWCAFMPFFNFPKYGIK